MQDIEQQAQLEQLAMPAPAVNGGSDSNAAPLADADVPEQPEGTSPAAAPADVQPADTTTESSAEVKKKKKKKYKKKKAASAQAGVEGGAEPEASASARDQVVCAEAVSSTAGAADDEEEWFEDALSEPAGGDDTAEDQRQEQEEVQQELPAATSSQNRQMSANCRAFDPTAWGSFLSGPKSATVAINLPDDLSHEVAAAPARGPVMRYSLAKHAVKNEDKWLQAPHNRWQPEGGAGGQQC